MDVGKCCTRNVAIADRETGVIEVADLMRRRHVGSVVIVERAASCNRPIGIVTDRDLVVSVLALGADARQLTAEDVMSPDLATALAGDDVLDTLHRMRHLGIRRMPVVDGDGGLQGMIAVDDLLELVADSMNEVVGLVGREVRLEVERRP